VCKLSAVHKTSVEHQNKRPILLSAVTQEYLQVGISEWVKSNFDIRYFGEPLSQSDSLKVQVFCSNVFPIVDENFCSLYPNMRFVLSPTTGLTHVDVEYLEENLIELISLRGRQDFLREITSTSEFAWGLILSVWRKIPQASSSNQFNVENRDSFVSRQLRGREIGLIGFGRIGSKVAEYALAFGMKVNFFDPYCDLTEKGIVPQISRHDSVESLISVCDIVLICASVIDQDRGNYPLINDKNIDLMRDESVLVNISRGIFLDELAIENALVSGKLFGVGLDVLTREEFSSVSSQGNLFNLKNLGYNIVITPHIGGMSSDALTLCIAEIFKGFEERWVSKAR
jgi:D-3-phosphoglycerate dehydrogenase